MGIVFSLIGAAVSAGDFALMVAGFTPAGIAAGSLAAAVQSSIGSVVAGSGFATSQVLGSIVVVVSVGAIGAGVAVAGAAAAGGAAAAAAANENESVDEYEKHHHGTLQLSSSEEVIECILAKRTKSIGFVVNQAASLNWWLSRPPSIICTFFCAALLNYMARYATSHTASTEDTFCPTRV